MAIIFNLNQRYSGGLPDGYHDTSQVTAAAGDIKSGKKIVDAAGEIINGSMPVNGTTGGTISTKDATVNIPAGYTTGGSVSISSTERAKIIADNIKQGVTILGVDGSAGVPSGYHDTSQVTAAAGDVITGKKIVNASGAVVNGTMPNNGAVSGSINGMVASSYNVPAGYHNGSGSVTLTGDIETALAAI